MYNRSMKQIYFTEEGFEELKKKLETLKVERVHAVGELKKAREMGDLSENGYYKASKMKLVSLDRELRDVQYKLKYASIIQKEQSDEVNLGSKVTLSLGEKEVTYDVVGEYEADPKKGKISNVSPLGQALLRKRAGEKVNFKTPNGGTTYTILKIN